MIVIGLFSLRHGPIIALWRWLLVKAESAAEAVVVGPLGSLRKGVGEGIAGAHVPFAALHSACVPVSGSERVTERLFRPDVTVAAVVFRDERFLLVEESVRGSRVLNQPAGHLEAGESLAEAARRETLEETGWDIELSAYLGTYQWTSPGGESFLRFAFVGEARQHHPERQLDDGIEQVLWLPREALAGQLERLRSPLVLNVIDDYLGGARFPLEALRWISP